MFSIVDFSVFDLKSKIIHRKSKMPEAVDESL